MTSNEKESNCGKEERLNSTNADVQNDVKNSPKSSTQVKSPVSNSTNESYSSKKKLIAESLREHLVIEHEKEISVEKSITDNATDDLQTNENSNAKQNENNEDTIAPLSENEEGPGSMDDTPELDQTNSGSAQVTLVKKGQQSYTKITTHKSAFTPTHSNHENRCKRLKNDPHLQHLMPRGRESSKPYPLLRSTSMPVSVESELSDGETSEKPTPGTKGILPHRTIYRTGSVSDYTRQKLKTSILMRTSASLVRKPSITEQEIRHLQADADSSLSDDDEEDIDEEMSSQFKPVSASAESSISTETTGTLSCGAESGAVENRHRETVPDIPTSSLVSSSLAGPAVTHVIAITSS